MSRRKGLFHFLAVSFAFIIGTYAISNLMPLTIRVGVRGPSVADAEFLLLNLALVTGSIWFLGRAIYRLDKRAGRIRNKVGWLE